MSCQIRPETKARDFSPWPGGCQGLNLMIRPPPIKTYLIWTKTYPFLGGRGGGGPKALKTFTDPVRLIKFRDPLAGDRMWSPHHQRTASVYQPFFSSVDISWFLHLPSKKGHPNLWQVSGLSGLARVEKSVETELQFFNDAPAIWCPNVWSSGLLPNAFSTVDL